MTRTFGNWWHDLNGGQQQALAQKFWMSVGNDAVAQKQFEALLRGDVTVELIFKDGTVVLVDKNGRCIPTKAVTAEVVDANWQYHLVQPKIDYKAVLARLRQAFPEAEFCSAEEFQQRATALRAVVDANRQTKNLNKGVGLPICIPKYVVADYGCSLDEYIIPAVKRSYEAQFPGRPFTNYREGELAGQVKVIEKTRHEQLVEAMHDGPVVGMYYPTAFQGFGIEADRQMIEMFPRGFLLSGAIDTAVAWVAYPETMARDGYTPINDCAALQWQDPVYSLGFRARGDRASFGRRLLIAFGNCSGSLLFLG